MAIYRHRDKWRCEVFVDGRRVASKSGFDRQRDAKDWHDDKRRAFSETAKPKDHTFEELLGHFKGWHLPSIRPGTRTRYLVDIDQRIEPFFRYMKLERIDATMVETFKAKCAEKLSPKSVNNCLHTLRLMLNKAVRWKMLGESPYAVESLEIPEAPYPWWDKEEDIQAFLKAAKESRYYAVYLTALETGLRYGELAGLAVGDVDLHVGAVHVHRQWLEREGAYGPPKHGRNRRVDFDPKGGLAETLRGVVGHRGADSPLFTTASGRRITKSGVAHKYFKACIRRAAILEISFHGLRHTFASWYMRQHDDVWSLMAILGHSSIKTTMRYAHQSKRARRKPLDLASITQKSRTELGGNYLTGEDLRGKEWRDGRDLNPNAAIA